MDPAQITTAEIAIMVVLVALLIAAITLIIQHSKTPSPERTSFQNLIVPLLAGLAMLDFILINLVGADILDPDRALTVSALITVVLINLPLAGITIWAFIKTSRN